jgi:trans-aconitate methyltransferase
VEDTDRHWKLWGELDPYRGVCYPEGGDSPEFWESGERYTTSLLNAIARIYPSRGCENALDFGCGVGRILRPLATRYRRVVGVDISPAMLALARRNVPEAELTAQLPDERFDLVHSYLVLQHIPPRRGLEIVRRLRRCVAPGGVIALHAPVEVRHSPVYRVKHAVPALRFLLNALQGKPLREPLMQMNPYPVRQMCEALESDETWIIPRHDGLIFCGRC